MNAVRALYSDIHRPSTEYWDRGLQTNTSVHTVKGLGVILVGGVCVWGGAKYSMNSRAPTSLAVCNVDRGGSGQCNLRSY